MQDHPPATAGAAPGDAQDATLPALHPVPVDATVASLEVGRSVPDLPNEAIPAIPPPPPVDRVGSIPQVSAARRWALGQASNWRLYLVRFTCAGLAVVLTIALLPGLRFAGWHWGQFLVIAVVFGLLNMLVKPILQFLSLRFIFNTYGLVVVLINTLLLVLLGWLLDDWFQASRPLALLGGGLLVGLLGLVLETLLGANPPVLDRDYKERNGLR